jgi:FKBP12-rapamycin complex-associated protein
MAMLEAFVHDPLINWRLLNADVGETHGEQGDKPIQDIPEGAAASLPRRDLTRAQVLLAYGIQGDPSEALNDRAVTVMKRMSDKLTGRDFLPEGYSGENDSVKRQVRRLIDQATSHENLCQSYIGWCPWW